MGWPHYGYPGTFMFSPTNTSPLWFQIRLKPCTTNSSLYLAHILPHFNWRKPDRKDFYHFSPLSPRFGLDCLFFCSLWTFLMLIACTSHHTLQSSTWSIREAISTRCHRIIILGGKKHWNALLFEIRLLSIGGWSFPPGAVPYGPCLISGAK